MPARRHPEQDIQKALADHLRARAAAGIKDGRTYGLQLKADNGRVSPAKAQAQAHEATRAAGAVAVGIDEAIEHLEIWQLLRGHSQ